MFQSVLAAFTAVVIVGGLAQWDMLFKWRIVWGALVTALLGFWLRELLLPLGNAMRSPPLFDFACFWLYGRVAITTHAMYAPASFHTAAHHLSVTPVFAREVLDVGFPYPPTTIALVAPLGLFPSEVHAFAFWSAFNLAAAAFAAVVVWRKFFRRYSGAGALGSIALLAGCAGIAESFAIGQDIALLLLFVVLHVCDDRPVQRGIWLALACAVKPFALVLFIYPAVKWRGREVLGGVITLAVLFAAAILIAGWNNILTYLTAPPYGRAPAWVYTEGNNQSLSAALLRAGVHDGVIAALVLVMLAGAALVCRIAREQDRRLCAGLLVTVALLIYPATEWFYAPALLVVLLALFERRGVLGNNAVTVCVAYGALLLALMTVRFAGVEIAAPVASLCVISFALWRSLNHGWSGADKVVERRRVRANST